MMVTGESTGELAEMMGKVADYYQEQHKMLVDSLKTLIEPILIIFLAVVVGGIIISVIVPIFSLYQSML
jgi:type IV pilus assembly protein PilC